MEIDNRICCQQCDIQASIWPFASLEMVILVLGLTGSTMVLGWTQGVGLAEQNGYTPIWACIVLIVLLSLLVMSLIVAMAGIHFRRSGLIAPHIFFLLLSWIINFFMCIATCVLGGPILTAVFIILYFTLLLAFAWTLFQFCKWTIAIANR
uniref:MARVEL domain-containing protein n=1 Tax=Plectus sambesii TaxID=2011161 RepID=A0A914UL27_9BILA